MTHRRTVHVVALPALASALLTGCGADGDVGESEFLHGAGGVHTRTDSVLLRDVSIDEPQDGTYEPGDLAVLNVTFVNDTPAPRALTEVSSPVAVGVRILVDPACEGTPTQVRALPIEPQPTVWRPSAEVPDGPEEHFVVVLRLGERLRSGESAPVSFGFDNGEQVQVQVPVELAGEVLDVDDDLDCERPD